MPGGVEKRDDDMGEGEDDGETGLECETGWGVWNMKGGGGIGR